MAAGARKSSFGAGRAQQRRDLIRLEIAAGRFSFTNLTSMFANPSTVGHRRRSAFTFTNRLRQLLCDRHSRADLLGRAMSRKGIDQAPGLTLGE